MKKIILGLLLIFISCTSFSIIDQEYGEWKQADGYPNIWFRVKFDYYNEWQAKDGKPPYVWCLQIQNRNEKKIGISWGVTDMGKTSADIDDWRRNSCMAAGEIAESCIHFTNTPEGGTILVFFDKMEDCNY